MEILLILALAVVIDLALGDPPDIVHPVAWMGKVIALLEKGGLKLNPVGQFVYGMAMTIFTTALFVLRSISWFIYLADFNQIAYIIVAAVLLKLTFSIRGLRRTALKIKRLLQEDKLDKTRFELRALVSRDTQDLTEPLLVSAAVESVAEGTCDSLVAPLFYFLLLGVPGAIGYRAVNTLDSMIGYHGKYEYLGKFAARLDDVLNFIPARLAALLLVLAAAMKKTVAMPGKRPCGNMSEPKAPTPAGRWPPWPARSMSGWKRWGITYWEKEGPAPCWRLSIAPLEYFSLAASIWIVLCFIAGGIRIAVTA